MTLNVGGNINLRPSNGALINVIDLIEMNEIKISH